MPGIKLDDLQARYVSDVVLDEILLSAVVAAPRVAYKKIVLESVHCSESQRPVLNHRVYV